MKRQFRTLTRQEEEVAKWLQGGKKVIGDEDSDYEEVDEE